MSLSAVEDLGGHKRLEILMVRKHLDRVSRPFEVMPPMSHTFDYYKYFAIMDVIIAFRRDAFSGVKGHRVPSGVVKLTDNAGDSKTGSVRVNLYQEFRIEVFQDRCRSELLF